MDKILVEVYLPSANRSYDVYIPLQSKLYEVIQLLSRSLMELSEGYFIPTDDTVICDKETGIIYSVNMSIEELELHNGSKLMMI